MIKCPKCKTEMEDGKCPKCYKVFLSECLIESIKQNPNLIDELKDRIENDEIVEGDI